MKHFFIHKICLEKTKSIPSLLIVLAISIVLQDLFELKARARKVLKHRTRKEPVVYVHCTHTIRRYKKTVLALLFFNQTPKFYAPLTRFHALRNR